MEILKGMSFCSSDPKVKIETFPIRRTTIEVKRFDEIGGERDCVDEATETEEGIFVENGFVVEGERCE
jgi:hypothetical protein